MRRLARTFAVRICYNGYFPVPRLINKLDVEEFADVEGTDCPVHLCELIRTIWDIPRDNVIGASIPNGGQDQSVHSHSLNC